MECPWWLFYDTVGSASQWSVGLLWNDRGDFFQSWKSSRRVAYFLVLLCLVFSKKKFLPFHEIDGNNLMLNSSLLMSLVRGVPVVLGLNIT